MAASKEFLIRVAADIKSAQAQLGVLAGHLEDLGKAGSGGAQEGLNDTKDSADKANKSVGQLTDSMVRFAAAIGVFKTLRAFVEVNIELQAIQATLQAATGDVTVAAQEFKFMVQQADRLGLSIAALARPYAQLIAASKGTALEGQATRDVFIAIAEAGSVLKWSTTESERAMRAVQQIMSKGTVSAEELRLQLGDVLPGAMQLAARAMGVTTAEFQKMLANGEVLSNQFLPRFAEEIRTTFGPGVEQSIHNLGAEINRLKNNMFQLATAIGEAGVTQFLTDLANAANTGVLALRELIRTGDLLQNKTVQQLANSFKSSTAGGAGPVSSFLLEGVNTPPAPVASQGPTPEDVDKANSVAQKLTETLRVQAAVLKLGEFAAIDYRRAHGDLSNATQEEMEKIYESIFALASVRDEIDKAKEVEKQNIEIMRERNKLMEDGTRITEAMKTPVEKIAAEMDRLDTLLAEGAINQETYNRAMFEAIGKMDKLGQAQEKLSDSARIVAQGMNSAMEQYFFDVMDGNFENMADNFARALKRMYAQLLASQLIKYLQPGASVTPGAGVQTTPQGVSPTPSTINVRSTGLTRSASPVAGLSSGAGGGAVTVQIENKGTPQQAQQGRAQFDARGLVVSVVTEDLRSGGPIASSIERTYNTRRKV